MDRLHVLFLKLNRGKNHGSTNDINNFHVPSPQRGPYKLSKKAETLRDRYNTHLNATRESIIDKARLLADDTISDKLRAVSTDDMISAESVVGDIADRNTEGIG